MTTSLLDPHVPATDIGRGRRGVAAVLLAAGAITVAGILAADPFDGNSNSYEHVRRVRDAAWAGAVVDGLGSVALGLGLALVLGAVVHGRAAIVARVAGFLTAAGGVLFAMGIYAGGALSWYATDVATMSPEAGDRLLQRAVEESPAHLIVPQMAGYLALYGLGLLLAAIALLWSRAAPAWIPIGIVATAVLGAVTPERVGEYFGLLQMALLTVLAAVVIRDRAR